MADPQKWSDWKKGDPPPPGPPPQPGEDGYGAYQAYLAYKQAGEDTSTSEKQTTGSSSPTFTNNNQPSNYTPTPPQPREAYGPYLAGDLANRTIGIDAKTRVDPYTSQR